MIKRANYADANRIAAVLRAKSEIWKPWQWREFADRIERDAELARKRSER